MIYNKKGEKFFYEDKMFLVGEEVFSTESAFYGLLGNITEIRTGDDRDTENEGPDIYCKFRKPVMVRDKGFVHDMIFGADNSVLDLVIMAPEMLLPTRTVKTGLPDMKVYAVIEDSVVDGEKHRSTKLFTDPQHAEIVLNKSIERECEEGCIAEWLRTKLYADEHNGKTYFKAYLKNEYCFNHYYIRIEEQDLTLSIPFAEQMLPISLAMKYREDVAEQILPWKISEEVRRTSINDPNLYNMVTAALEGKDLYREEYSEAISEVAYKLTEEHAKIEQILKQERKEGK